MSTKTAVRLLTVPALFLGFSVFNAGAVPLCTSLNGGSPTLASLIAASTTGGCQFDDKIFSDFVYNFTGGTSSGAVTAPTVPAPSTVDAVFSDSGSFTNGIPSSVTLAFNFTVNNSISNYQTLNLALQYQVDIVPGTSAAITGMAGTTTASLAPGNNTDTLQAQKDSCGGAGFQYNGAGSTPTDACSGPENNLVYKKNWSRSGSVNTLQTNGGNTSFAGLYTTVGTWDSVAMSGGTGTVSGTKLSKTTQISNTFDEAYHIWAPEPAPVVMIGGAFLLLGARARRKKSV